MSTERPFEARAYLKPNAELRKALAEGERSFTFFEEGKYIDYFQSINEVYLKGRGTITGPCNSLNSSLSDDISFKNQLALELEQSHGAAYISLEWEDLVEITKNQIFVSVSYHESTNCYRLVLFARKERELTQDEVSIPLSRGDEIQRDFWLNPEPVLNKYVDDVLLTFTTELLDSDILKYD